MRPDKAIGVAIMVLALLPFMQLQTEQGPTDVEVAEHLAIHVLGSLEEFYVHADKYGRDDCATPEEWAAMEVLLAAR